MTAHQTIEAQTETISGAEMVVREPPPPGLNDDPLGFDDAVRHALQAE